MIYSGIIVACFTLLVIYIGAEPLRNLDRMSYDLMMRSLATKKPHPSIVIVDIDEESLARFGQWPWPRNQLARLMNILVEGKPYSVGVDVLFPERDSSSPVHLSEKLKTQYGVDIDLANIPAGSVDNDLLLSQALTAGPFNLGVMFRFENNWTTTPPLPSPKLNFIEVQQGEGGSHSLITADGAIAPIPPLAQSADRLGFVNVVPDQDGIIRKTPLLIRYDDQIFPSLALAAFMHFRQTNEIVLRYDRNGIASIRCADTTIPVDRSGYMAIGFRGPTGSYPSISAGKVLAGEIAPDAFNQKIVFIGSSAEGLKDTHPTPFDRTYTGVEVHASAVGTLLDRDFIDTPYWSLGVQGTVLVSALLLTLIAALTFPARVAGLIFSGFLLIIPAGSGILFIYKHLFISPASVLAIYIMSFALIALIRFRSEEIRKIRDGRLLIAAQDSALAGLASLVETRDIETGNHIFRTQKYVRVLAEHLAKKNPEQFYFSPTEIDLLCKSSALHDIGKVGVPDRILLKPGKLTAAEFDEIKKHTVNGAEAIQRADKVASEPGETSFLQMAKEIALTHHEKWDGTGYPRGLKGEEIPVSGRIMAVADVYDALIMNRVYKDAMGHEEAAAIIYEGHGTQFDPRIVEAFQALEQDFKNISQQYQ